MLVLCQKLHIILLYMINKIFPVNSPSLETPGPSLPPHRKNGGAIEPVLSLTRYPSAK